MTKLSINTEKVTPLGGFKYDSSINKLLGSSPNLDDLSLFIREVAQNSWDARVKKEKVNDIKFEIEVATFTKTNSEAFKNNVFTGDEYAEKLIDLLVNATSEAQPYIVIRDIGTVGLNGPTEANQEDDEGKNNFISFVRNIGQDKHDENDGGTYGFGKSVFFRYSTTRTFITYTRTHDEKGNLVSRLMGMTLNKECIPSAMKCTGRHWWGVKPPNNVEDYNQPVTGDQADQLALSIGFRKYMPDETGTSVLLISPSFPFDNQKISLKSSEGRKIIATAMAETLNAWYWPRMMGSGDKTGKINSTVICDKQIIELPSLDQLRPLDLYTTAFEQIQIKIASPTAETNPQVFLREIIHGTSREMYGYLAIFKATKAERPPFAIQQLKERHPLAGMMWGSSDGRVASSNHVALIRNQGQVIRYLETTPCNRPTQEYGAVFFLHPTGINASEINKEVKASEQAAHDDWSTTKSKRANFIIRKITELIEEYVAPNTNQNNAGLGSTGRVSLMLADLWGDGEAHGGNKDDVIDPPPPPPPPSDKLTIKSEFKHGLYDGKKCIFVEATIPKSAKINANVDAYISTRNEISGSTDETKTRTLGWFNGDMDPSNPSKNIPISRNESLLITQDVIGKKVILVVHNASQHGLSIELKYS